MRALAVALLRWLAEALVRLYYPRRTIDGAANIPPGGPTLFVANHPNGLLDPLVFRVCSGRPVRFLAKSTLWGNPFGRLAMDAFRCMPVYRRQDVTVDQYGQSVARNEETFARCRAELAAGAELALYPEGTSHADPNLKPLKSGAARIALSAATEGGAAPVLIPVGTHYEDSAVFRSSVHLVVGLPIEFGEEVKELAIDQRRAIEHLTDKMRARLNELVLQAETQEILAGVARVASWTATDAEDDSHARRHTRTRELLAAYAILKARDPARLEEVAQAARDYARALGHLGVRDPWTIEAPRVSVADTVLALGRALLMLPAAIWGALTSWVPYRLSGVVARRMTSDVDVLSTVKMIVGTTFLVVAWIVEAVVLGWRGGLAVGLASLVLAPLAGYAALRLGETLREVWEAFRHLGWRTRAPALHKVGVHRRRLAEDVARALREAAEQPHEIK